MTETSSPGASAPAESIGHRTAGEAVASAYSMERASGLRPATTGQIAAALVIIWAAAFLAYSNSFNIAFQFDDTHTVQSNMYVRSLKYIPQYFVDAKTFSYRPENSGYRPMTTTTLALGFALSRMDTWGYHLIKLIEHCLVATLIFFIGLRLLPRSGSAAPFRFWTAGFAALIFVVHRALTETVDYISAVSTLQAGFFHFLAFYLYLRWRDTKRGALSYALFAVSLLCYLCSMWSKEEGITLPAMIWLHDWIYGRGPHETYLERFKTSIGRWIKLVGPYAAVAALFVFLRMTFQPAVADTSRGNTPTFIYFITQFRSWLHYWKLFFFPLELNADNLAFEFSPGLEDWRVWASLAVHVAVWAAAWIVGKKRKFVLFAVAWVYVTVLPASSFFPLVEAVNEHRFYIPYMLLSLLASWVVFESAAYFMQSRGKSAATGRTAAAVLLGVCAVALGAGAYERNKIWESDVSLWEDVYSKNPDSPRAMNVLGVSLLNRGNLERSVPMLEKCHQVAPAYLPCIVHLSIAYAQYKQFDKGLALLRYGNQVDPNYVHVNFHLGLYYKDYFADYEAARRHFTKVHELTSGRFFQAILKLAEMEMEDGRPDQGMMMANQVLNVDQSNGDAWDVLGKGYLLKGDLANSAQIFQRLIQSAPDSIRYLMNGANFSERKRDYPMAGRLYWQVTEKEPKAIQAWMGLARAAEVMKDAPTVAKAKAKIEALKADRSWVFLPSLFLPGEKPRQIKPE